MPKHWAKVVQNGNILKFIAIRKGGENVHTTTDNT
jgi:hypothetical protein